MRIVRCIKDTDLRTYGKGFGEYIERGAEEQGITHGGARPGEVAEDSITNNLNARYYDTESGDVKGMAVNTTVLSSDFVPPPGVRAPVDTRGVVDGRMRFLEADGDLPTPMDTNVPGIYSARARIRPMDVTEGVARGGGAADRAAQAISEFVGKASAKAGSGR